jgi:hypothetical protein
MTCDQRKPSWLLLFVASLSLVLQAACSLHGADCGKTGQVCCGAPFSHCDEGGCFNGTCKPCGSYGTACCPFPQSACNEGACLNGTCQQCGLNGKPCCQFPGNACNQGAACRNGTCGSCGGLNQTCCDTYGGTHCNAQLSCMAPQGGAGTCQACGFPGQQCCLDHPPCQNAPWLCGSNGKCPMADAGVPDAGSCSAQCSGAGAITQVVGFRNAKSGCSDYGCQTVQAPASTAVACAICQCEAITNNDVAGCQAQLVSGMSACMQYTFAETYPTGECKSDSFSALSNADAVACAKYHCPNCTVDAGTCP